MTIDNVKDRIDQKIEEGDHALIINDDIDTISDVIVKVLDVKPDDYGNVMAYVELAFRVKTDVAPVRFYVSPNKLILTKTKITI